MAEYSIYEENLSKLVTRLESIEKKCKAFGCEFKFETLGEDFREVKDDDGTVRVLKFIRVFAEGVANIDGWQIVAVIDHREAGNIVRCLDTKIEIPHKYYHTSSICEHCNTNRRRKDTILLYNSSINEFKQVGKSCLKAFTGQLDADKFAKYLSWFDELVKGETFSADFHSARTYYSVKEILAIACECIAKVGYFKSDSMYPTKLRVMHCYDHIHHHRPLPDEDCSKVIEALSADANALEVKVSDMLSWIRSSDEDFGYLFDLKMACSSDYITYRDIGLVASLVVAYDRHLAKLHDEQVRADIQHASEYIGEVGQTITIDNVKCEYAASYDTQFGVTRIFLFTDANSNVYIWKTSCVVYADNVVSVKGKIKAHTKFNGCKQTELTRCKVKYADEGR